MPHKDPLEAKKYFAKRYQDNKLEINRKSKERYKINPPTTKERRDIKYLLRYGITLEEFNVMLDKQKGLCAICLKPETSKNWRTKKPQTLSIDHNHETKKIRGLLCYRCNMGIGMMQENLQILGNAIKYLEEHSKCML